MIKIVSDLRQDGFLQVLCFSSINKTGRHNITEILLKVALNTITLYLLLYTLLRNI
jgi:hypothetical protein